MCEIQESSKASASGVRMQVVQGVSALIAAVVNPLCRRYFSFVIVPSELCSIRNLRALWFFVRNRTICFGSFLNLIL